MKRSRLFALLCCFLLGTGMAFAPSVQAAKVPLKKSPSALKDKGEEEKKKTYA